jgi:hypothetical protein
MNGVMGEYGYDRTEGINSECESYARKYQRRKDRRCNEVIGLGCGRGYAQPCVYSIGADHSSPSQPAMFMERATMVIYERRDS